jgi:hypothetical protein
MLVIINVYEKVSLVVTRLLSSYRSLAVEYVVDSSLARLLNKVMAFAVNMELSSSFNKLAGRAKLLAAQLKIVVNRRISISRTIVTSFIESVNKYRLVSLNRLLSVSYIVSPIREFINAITKELVASFVLISDINRTVFINRTLQVYTRLSSALLKLASFYRQYTSTILITSSTLKSISKTLQAFIYIVSNRKFGLSKTFATSVIEVITMNRVANAIRDFEIYIYVVATINRDIFINRLFEAPEVLSVKITKGITKIIAASVVLTTKVTRGIGKLFSVSEILTPVVIRGFGRLFNSAVALSSTVIRQISIIRAFATSYIVTPLRDFAARIERVLFATVKLYSSYSRILSIHRVFYSLISEVSSFSRTIRLYVNLLSYYALQASNISTKGIKYIFTAALLLVSTLSRSIYINRVFVATQKLYSRIVLGISKTLRAYVIEYPTIVRGITKIFRSNLVEVAKYSRGFFNTLITNVILIPYKRITIGKTFNTVMLVASDIGRTFSAIRNFVATELLSVSIYISKTGEYIFQVTMKVAVSVSRQLSLIRLFYVSEVLSSYITRGFYKILAVSEELVTNINRGIGKTFLVVVAVFADFSKLTSYSRNFATSYIVTPLREFAAAVERVLFASFTVTSSLIRSINLRRILSTTTKLYIIIARTVSLHYVLEVSQALYSSIFKSVAYQKILQSSMRLVSYVLTTSYNVYVFATYLIASATRSSQIAFSRLLQAFEVTASSFSRVINFIRLLSSYLSIQSSFIKILQASRVFISGLYISSILSRIGVRVYLFVASLALQTTQKYISGFTRLQQTSMQLLLDFNRRISKLAVFSSVINLTSSLFRGILLKRTFNVSVVLRSGVTRGFEYIMVVVVVTVVSTTRLLSYLRIFSNSIKLSPVLSRVAGILRTFATYIKLSSIFTRLYPPLGIRDTNLYIYIDKNVSRITDNIKKVYSDTKFRIYSDKNIPNDISDKEGR